MLEWAIKKAAMLAFGFLFLTVLLTPLKNFTLNLLQEKTALTLEKNNLIAETDNGAAKQQVLDAYKSRICEEISNALGKISLKCGSISVTVDEDQDSERFGYVEQVYCEISAIEGAEGEQKESIEKVRVPEIVIDLHGIRVEKSDTEADAGETRKNEYTQKAAQAISELTGAEESRINVKWGGTT